MQRTLIKIQTPFPLSKSSVCFNTISQTNTLLRTTTTAISAPRSPQTLFLSLSQCHRRNSSRTQSPILCARKRKMQILSAKSRKLILQLIPIIASNLKISPQPLNWFIAEIAGSGDGGNSGGGLGFWKGFGWGGFDGWRRKRNRNRNLVLYGFLMIFCLGFLIGRETIDSNAIWWVLGLSPIGVALIQNWIFGFCVCCFVLVSLGFRKEDMKKWIGKFGICFTMIEPRRRRKSGRTF